MAMWQQIKNNYSKKYIVISGLLLAILIVLIIFLIVRQANQPVEGSATIKTDTLSGQKYAEEPNKAPELYNLDVKMPIFLGVDSLLNSGLTTDQIEAMKSAFRSYAPFANYKNTISFSKNDLTSGKDSSRGDNGFYLETLIAVNNEKKYTVRIYYPDLETIQLLIYSQDKSSALFDSGTIKRAN